jgi:hypothetical protein
MPKINERQLLEYLHSWRSLVKVIAELNRDEIVFLLHHERNNKNRDTIVARLSQRLNRINYDIAVSETSKDWDS